VRLGSSPYPRYRRPVGAGVGRVQYLPGMAREVARPVDEHHHDRRHPDHYGEHEVHVRGRGGGLGRARRLDRVLGHDLPQLPGGVDRRVQQYGQEHAAPRGVENPGEEDRQRDLQRQLQHEGQVAVEQVENRGRGLAYAMETARDRVDEAWGSLEGRISIVSGKELLSKISSWSQRNFEVSLGVAPLLHELKVGELASEVVDVIGAIERTTSFTRDEGSL
jgi:hypothetical protein